jgi:hypothetical protein
VDSDVGDHATGHELTSDEVAQQCDLLAVFELNGEPYFDLAGELGVFAFLAGLDGVPEGVAVEDPGGGVFGS